MMHGLVLESQSSHDKPGVQIESAVHQFLRLDSFPRKVWE